MILKISSSYWEALTQTMVSAMPSEGFAYILCRKEDNVLFARYILLPEEDDLEEQGGAIVKPTRAFQVYAQALATLDNLYVVDTHTHPFQQQPTLSSTDRCNAAEMAAFFASDMPSGVGMGMLVLGRDLDRFDGVVWDRYDDRLRTVTNVRIVGSPTRELGTHEPISLAEDDVYARHRIIPNFDQELLGKLRVVVVGLGGVGSEAFASLVSLGVGESTGWIRACDPDIVEASNLPRITYASRSDLGKTKAAVAQGYAERKNPNLDAKCVPSGVHSEECESWMSEAHVMIVGVDDNLVRWRCNDLCVKYLVAMLDVSSEIIPHDNRVEAAGQVKVVLPGETGCLVCSGFLDPEALAYELMTEEDRDQHRQVGYVRGTNDSPTPSVLHLNGVASHLGISQFLRLVFGEDLHGKEFIHYDRQSASVLTAAMVPRQGCPVCGEDGLYAEASGQSDVFAIEESENLILLPGPDEEGSEEA